MSVASILSVVHEPCRLSLQVSGAAGGRGEAWKGVHSKLRDELPVDSLPPKKWTASHKLAALPQSTRVRDLVDLLHAQSYSKLKLDPRTAAEPDTAFERTQLIVDVTQDARRHTCSVNCSHGSQSLRSMCSGSNFYMFSRDRCVVPCEHMMLLGWSPAEIKRVLNNTPSLKPSALRDLAGEGMGAPCIGLAVASLMLVMGGQIWQ